MDGHIKLIPTEGNPLAVPEEYQMHGRETHLSQSYKVKHCIYCTCPEPIYA